MTTSNPSVEDVHAGSSFQEVVARVLEEYLANDHLCNACAEEVEKADE